MTIFFMRFDSYLRRKSSLGLLRRYSIVLKVLAAQGDSEGLTTTSI